MTQWHKQLGHRDGENRRRVRCPSIALVRDFANPRMSKDLGGVIAPSGPPG
jgi:hypothetical protein